MVIDGDLLDLPKDSQARESQLGSDPYTEIESKQATDITAEAIQDPNILMTSGGKIFDKKPLKLKDQEMPNPWKWLTNVSKRDVAKKTNKHPCHPHEVYEVYI